jgi:hypothetical protein
MATKKLAAGTRRAIHVYTKVLLERMKENKGQMLWLVRSSLHDYKKAMVVRRVNFTPGTGTYCTGEDVFDSPLPGTGGRGVAILFTDCEIVVEFDGKECPIIDMDDDKKPAEKPAVKPQPAPVRRGPRLVRREAMRV